MFMGTCDNVTKNRQGAQPLNDVGEIDGDLTTGWTIQTEHVWDVRRAEGVSNGLQGKT